MCKKTSVRIFLLFLSLLLLTSCMGPDYVAIVNGQKILTTDFNRNLAQLKQYYPKEAENNLKKYLLEDMVVDMVILQQAKDIEIPESEVEKQYQEIVETYDSEENLLKELKEFGFTKEDLLKDIKKQLIIAKYLEPVEDVDKHIEELVSKAEIKIME
jgi:hypothetical protein